MTVQFTIRQFHSDEWQQLKAIRLESLEREKGKFGASFEKSIALPDEEWQSRLTKNDCAYFGLFNGVDIIGLTGVYLSDADTAKFIASYIREEYRGQGLSRLLYQARINWARENGCRRAVTGHRKSNAASKAANQKFGFVYLETESAVAWPDGTTEDHLVYELVL